MFSNIFSPAYKKKNLLLLGASGGVSNAFLHSLVHHRNLLNKLILVDKNDAVRSDEYIDHKALDYQFFHEEINIEQNKKRYEELINQHHIDIVLDLTDMDSIPILEATNALRVSYINTAMNDEKRTVSDLVMDVHARKEKINGAHHILCTGMNPGVVNMWVKFGIEKHGIPKELIHFEYDTSTISLGWHAMMTWSLKEFIVESFRDPGGYMEGKDKVKLLYPNSLKHREDMTHILHPIMRLDEYPHGFHVLHEENVSIAQAYNLPTKFIYAFNLKTMDELVHLYDEHHNIYQDDLVLGDNLKHPLDGSDNIGVILQYDDKKIYYFNSAPNIAAIGTSGTYSQVIVGVFSALFVLLFENKLKKGTYFVEDLYDTYYRYYLFDNMRVQEYVFSKHEEGYKLSHFTPQIKIHRKNYLEYIYI